MSKFVALICVWFLSQLFVFKHISGISSLKLGITLNPDRILFLIIISSFLIQVLRKKIKMLPLGKVELMMLLFAIYCTISLWLSGADVGLESNRWLTTLFNLIYFPFTTYIIAKNKEFSRKELVALLTTMSIMGLYLALTGIFEHYKINGLVWPKYIMDPGIGTQWGRSRGPFVSSGTMGRVLILTFLSTTLLINYSGPVKRIFLSLTLLLIPVSIYFTSTRSPWLAFAIALMILVSFRTRLRRPALIIIVVATMGILAGVGSKLSFWQDSLFTSRDQTINYRMANYLTDIEMIKDNPLFGVGYGNFVNVWELYLSDKATSYDITQLNDGNHNTFLGLLSELGIAGFGLYMLIYLYILRECMRIYKRLNDEQHNEKSLVVIAMTMLAVYFIVGQFADLRFQQLQPNIMFLFFGLVSRLAMREKMVYEPG